MPTQTVKHRGRLSLKHHKQVLHRKSTKDRTLNSDRTSNKCWLIGERRQIKSLVKKVINLNMKFLMRLSNFSICLTNRCTKHSPSRSNTKATMRVKAKIYKCLISLSHQSKFRSNLNSNKVRWSNILGLLIAKETVKDSFNHQVNLIFLYQILTAMITFYLPNSPANFTNTFKKEKTNL